MRAASLYIRSCRGPVRRREDHSQVTSSGSGPRRARSGWPGPRAAWRRLRSRTSRSIRGPGSSQTGQAASLGLRHAARPATRPAGPGRPGDHERQSRRAAMAFALQVLVLVLVCLGRGGGQVDLDRGDRGHRDRRGDRGDGGRRRARGRGRAAARSCWEWGAGGGRAPAWGSGRPGRSGEDALERSSPGRARRPG